MRKFVLVAEGETSRGDRGHSSDGVDGVVTGGTDVAGCASAATPGRRRVVRAQRTSAIGAYDPVPRPIVARPQRL
ncbi:hypothetical protein EVAR_35228_1 [Eumeta japonica]|uniref:Uncharacterized protein n=1 Tax=Eumeta variegata TaxID=151549 RepID=A0A4C1VFB4_EUMVA|nr:hypothetical protein EVAR_35228_1 [Eumeta japonica]